MHRVDRVARIYTLNEEKTKGRKKKAGVLFAPSLSRVPPMREMWEKKDHVTDFCHIIAGL